MPEMSNRAICGRTSSSDIPNNSVEPNSAAKMLLILRIFDVSGRKPLNHSRTRVSSPNPTIFACRSRHPISRHGHQLSCRAIAHPVRFFTHGTHRFPACSKVNPFGMKKSHLRWRISIVIRTRVTHLPLHCLIRGILRFVRIRAPNAWNGDETKNRKVKKRI